MSDVTIRSLEEPYIPEAGILMEKMWREHAASTRLIDPQAIMSIPGQTYIRNLLDDDQAFVLAALQENHVIGIMSCLIKSLPPFYRHQREFYLDDLCVAENARRQGVASKLIKAAENIARQHNISVLTGKIWAFNDASQAVFKSQGYEPDYSCWHKLI